MNSLTNSTYCISSPHSTLELPPPMPARYRNIDFFATKIDNIHPANIHSTTIVSTPIKSSISSIPYITSPISPSSSGTSSASPKSLLRLDELSTTSRRIGEELFNVVLKKINPSNVRGCGTFGFSVSDGDATHPGIYVNAVIPGSPADGKLQPMDRVLQVNFNVFKFKFFAKKNS